MYEVDRAIGKTLGPGEKFALGEEERKPSFTLIRKRSGNVLAAWTLAFEALLNSLLSKL